MARRCLLYYITDRTAFADDEPTRRQRLLEKITEAASAGVDYIQLREKDLSVRDLESLAREAASIITKLRTGNPSLQTALLINSRTDVALAVGANGVHLRSEDISPRDVRKIWKSESGADTSARQLSLQDPIVAISCHSPAEVTRAAAQEATFAVFAPVFEKHNAEKHNARPPSLKVLSEASRTSIPVLALGGITLANAQSCMKAGAAGIAAIRLFQENDIGDVVKHLRW